MSYIVGNYFYYAIIILKLVYKGRNMRKLYLVCFVLMMMLVGLASNASAQTFQDLPVKERKEILHRIAIEKGIPPELLKAIALTESNMSQFKDGKPRVSNDGGIGMMQVTLTDAEIKKMNVDLEHLKYDTAYNVEIGASILLEKWKNPNLPVINNKDASKLEHWYFAVMAYNGLSKRNDPNFYGNNAYQEKVYQNIRDFALLPLAKITDIQINYQPNSDIMFFPPGVHYTIPKEAETVSTGLTLKSGQKVIIDNPTGGNVNLRTGPDGIKIDAIPHGMKFQILNVSESNNIHNLYNFYEVKNEDYQGFVASSYLDNYRLVLMNVPSNPNHKEAIGRLFIRRDNTELLKIENGLYVKDRGLKEKEALRLYGIKDGYYHVGNRYVKDDDTKVGPMIGRAHIQDNGVILYKRTGYGQEEKVKTLTKGEGLRVYSVSEKAHNVGNGYFVKKQNNVRFYIGFVHLKNDTILYSQDGKPYANYKAGQQYRVYGIDGNKILTGGGYYFINDAKVEYQVH